MTEAAIGVVEPVAAALDEAAVHWAVLRGRLWLAGSAHDVDMLVAAEDLDSLEDVVFAVGGVALPRSLHPWHRFYRFEHPDSGEPVVLDVVTELIYHRQLRICSGLERSCLDRRRREDGLWVLHPTDLFWTVLLHSVLDKPSVSVRRRTELMAALSQVARPSLGEAFFAGLCPSGWSPDRALDAVAFGEWESLSRLGRSIVADRRPPTTGRHGRTPGAVRRVMRRAAPLRAARTAARTIYPTVWRRVGLGATPRVLGVVEASGLDATVLDVRRRPGLCDVLLLLPQEHLDQLLAGMRQQGYRRLLGGWVLRTGVGVERVRAFSTAQLTPSAPAWNDIWASATPMFGRVHCRRVPAGTPHRALLVARRTS